MNKIETARLKYKPDTIKYLMVAETPPRSDSNRFFYFENVNDKDSLFIETIKVIYASEIKDLTIKEIRKNKKYFLDKFISDGYYLIDSLDIPFEKKYSKTQKIKLISAGQTELLRKINSLTNSKTKVILIAAPVFEANYLFLKQSGINIINIESIDFPGSGGQRNYRDKMIKILN